MTAGRCIALSVCVVGIVAVVCYMPTLGQSVLSIPTMSVLVIFASSVRSSPNALPLYSWLYVFSLAGQPLATPTILVGVARGWPARLESGNEEGQARVPRLDKFYPYWNGLPACCGDQRSRAEGGAGASSSGEDLDKN